MKHHYNRQSFLLALLLAAVLPVFLFWLRIAVLSMNTSLTIDPAILGAALVCCAGGVFCARRTRRMPLYTGILWLLWFLLPPYASILTGTASSVVLLTAVLWGFLSVPAAAEFLTNILAVKRTNA